MPKTCVVIGGGIGGLTAGICLARLGWSVRLFEQAAAFAEVGAGIQLSPNAMRVFAAISRPLHDSLVEQGVQPQALALRDGLRDRHIFSVPLGRRWNAPYVNIYRPVLIDCLAAAARELGVDMCLGQTVDLDQLESLKRRNDVVVVANGLHSTIVQDHFFAPTPEPSGHIAYRAVVDCADLVPNASVGRIAPDRHAVTYRVRRADRELCNFVGIVEAPTADIAKLDLGWQPDDAKAAAQLAFKNFGGDIPQVLHRATTVRPWPLFHRAPLPTWHNRNAVVLGDAAHPMLPTFAQGAAMAIEDAWVLAAQLSGSHSVNNALSRYTGIRLPRVQAVYDQAMRNLHLFHQKGTLNRIAGTLAPWVAGKVAPQVILGRFDAVYKYDVTRNMM